MEWVRRSDKALERVVQSLEQKARQFRRAADAAEAAHPWRFRVSGWAFSFMMVLAFAMISRPSSLSLAAGVVGSVSIALCLTVVAPALWWLLFRRRRLAASSD